MGEEDDLYVSEGTEEEGGEDESSNRTFLFIMIGMGAVFLCTLGLIAVYFLVLAPQQQRVAGIQATTVAANNAMVIAQMTEMARPTDTPSPTNTLPPSKTPTPAVTNTPVVVMPSATPTVTDTPGPATASPTATPTGRVTSTSVIRTASAVGAGTPQTPGQLSETGVGGVELIVLAAGLVALLFIARRLRMSQQ